MEAGNHVYTRRHHRRGMDESTHGSRSLHGIGKPDKNRNLGRLSRSTDKEKKGCQGDYPHAPDFLVLDQGGKLFYLAEYHCAMPHFEQGPEDKENSEQKTEIAHTIDNEGLVAGSRVCMIPIPETNQGVGTESYSLPTDEHQQEVVGHDEKQHGEGEEIEEGKITPVGFVIMHVAYGIEVDQASHAGHHQDHDGRKGIHPEGHIHV